jgi:hypothetical protein
MFNMQFGQITFDKGDAMTFADGAKGVREGVVRMIVAAVSS